MKDILWVLATLVILFTYSACVGPVFGQTQTKTEKIHSYCASNARAAEQFAEIRDKETPKKELEDYIIKYSSQKKLSWEQEVKFLGMTIFVYRNTGLSHEMIYRLFYRRCIAESHEVTV